MNKEDIVKSIDIHAGLRTVNPAPVDWWSGPYKSIEEANTSIPIAIRYPTMIIRIANDDGVFLYWYKDGIEDNNLVQCLHEDFEKLKSLISEKLDKEDFTDTVYTEGDNISIVDGKISVIGQLGLTEEQVKKVKVYNAKNADTVGGKTVGVDVPADAKFTDTIVDISGKADKEELANLGYGDMLRSVYDTDNSGIVDNAKKVNGFTVKRDVPADAKFTDTIVDISTKADSGGSTKTLKELDDTILALVSPPTYVKPSLSIELHNTIAEVGTSNIGTINGVFTQNDGGEPVSWKIFKNNTLVSETSSYNELGKVVLGDTIYRASVEYSEGAIKENNIGVLDDTGMILPGVITSEEKIITGILPYFWGAFENKPDLNNISLDTFKKVVEVSDGNVLIPMNIKDKYLAIAIPSTSTKKRKWEITIINSGNIGIGNLITEPKTKALSSPDGLWSGENYDIYITEYASCFEPKLKLKNI